VRTWKKRTAEFMKQAVERMEEGKDLGVLARELGVHVRTQYRWRDRQLGREKKVQEPVPREKKLEDEIQKRGGRSSF